MRISDWSSDVCSSDLFDSTSHIFILSIGVIGLWRYGWWFTHYARCILYRRVVFPKLRRAADEVDACGFKAGHVYVLCTSYRTDPRVTSAVYEGPLRNIAPYGAPTTEVAAIHHPPARDCHTPLLD